MSKIYSLYENKLDKAWYNSSNVFYSECDDHDNALKTVRVTFNNGSTYQYKDVNVSDYILFRESLSNGKALNKYIRKYDCEKLENRDISLLTEELNAIVEAREQEIENNMNLEPNIENG